MVVTAALELEPLHTIHDGGHLAVVNITLLPTIL